MMSRRNVLFIVTAIVGSAAGFCRAETEEQRLGAVVARSAEMFATAFKDRDAKSVAALFTLEAEYVDATGTVFHGRTAIEAEYGASFQVDPPGTLRIEVVSIRPVAAGVIVEDGISTFTAKEGGATTRARYTATHVKQPDGTWLMASVRELEAGRMTHQDRLQKLSWLVGRWHEELDGGHVSTEWKWSEDGNFLLSDFSVRQSRDVNWKGTHRVGWDAERKQFRSWVFDSNGGTADGWWRMDLDGTWSVNLSGIDADGVRVSSTMKYVRDGADALIILQEQRVRGGESLAGSTHRVVRQPPAPGSPNPVTPGKTRAK